MTLKECYDQMGGNYDAVLARLRSETLIKKFVLKFLADKSFETLTAALNEKNAEEAFRASHTLKGVCQNLGFDSLLSSSHDLTEALRAGNLDGTEALYSKVSTDYEKVVCAIRQFEKSNV